MLAVGALQDVFLYFFFFSLPAFSRKVGKLVGKIATFYYGLDSCRSGKLSRENNSLETCSREKDVAPKKWRQYQLRSIR